MGSQERTGGARADHARQDSLAARHGLSDDRQPADLEDLAAGSPGGAPHGAGGRPLRERPADAQRAQPGVPIRYRDRTSRSRCRGRPARRPHHAEGPTPSGDHDAEGGWRAPSRDRRIYWSRDHRHRASAVTASVRATGRTAASRVGRVRPGRGRVSQPSWPPCRSRSRAAPTRSPSSSSARWMRLGRTRPRSSACSPT